MGLRGRRVTGPRTGLPTIRSGCDAERQLLGSGRDDESSLRVPLRGRRWGRPLLPAAVARVAPREDEAPSAGAQSDDRPVRASNGAVLLDDFDGPFDGHGSARLLHDASCSCPRCGPRFITAALHGSPPVPLSDRHHGTLLAEPLAPRHELSDSGRPGRVTRPLPWPRGLTSRNSAVPRHHIGNRERVGAGLCTRPPRHGCPLRRDERSVRTAMAGAGRRAGHDDSTCGEVCMTGDQPPNRCCKRLGLGVR